MRRIITGESMSCCFSAMCMGITPLLIPGRKAES